jgi:DNA topoisomerase VI subunit B
MAPTSSAQLLRETFTITRASEYFSLRELQAMTGQPQDRFVAMALKELVDNGLDAAETAGVAPAIALEVQRPHEQILLTVQDNGPGLNPAVLTRQLDFTTRTSDKVAYRSPTRGAQGNALKTIIGLPHALGSQVPLLIEACGVRHQIRAGVDPAGEVRIDHATEAIPTRAGTRITLQVPATRQGVNAARWARRFALFNPHASVKIHEDLDPSERANSDPTAVDDFYQPLAIFPALWRKWVPTDPTSPWWYDWESMRRLVFLHIAQQRQDATRDLLLRDFVRQFRGLTATAKAAAVCAQVPSVRRLSDFDGDADSVDALLQAMCNHAACPKPSLLGLIGETALRTRLNAWHGIIPGRWWYACTTAEDDGIPIIVEAAVAETETEGDLYTGINFSPTFEDPTGQTHLITGQYNAFGFRGALVRCGASPRDNGVRTAAVLHIVAPALQFLDRGKTRLELPAYGARAVGQVTGRITKVLYADHQRREKDAARAERQDAERRDAELRAARRTKLSLVDAVFQVLPDALAAATGDGQYPVSVRNLYYAVRPRIQPLVARALEYTYFSQNLLIQYRAAHGAIPGLYYDPRGILYEPHSGREVRLGTREVDDYQFPSWLYDKILYVEKKGLWPMLQAAQLAERYDLAVVAAEGYATEAARTLFAHAEQGRAYTLFVLHDADADGYNIARTLAEETVRMPGHHVNVIDCGLTLAAARALHLEEEEFTRKKAIPRRVEDTLDEDERAYFIGRPVGRPVGPKSWVCRRIELNAMTAPQLIGLIQQKLDDAGVTAKVVPPDRVIAQELGARFSADVATAVDEAIAKLIDTPAIHTAVAKALRERALRPRPDMRRLVERILRQKRTWPWRDVVRNRMHARVDRLSEVLQAEARAALISALEASDLQDQDSA